jgi:hypothetical protein
MADDLKRCPNPGCYNDSTGDHIYLCKNCGSLFCEKCGDSSGLFARTNCPKCHSSNTKFHCSISLWGRDKT